MLKHIIVPNVIIMKMQVILSEYFSSKSLILSYLKNSSFIPV